MSRPRCFAEFPAGLASVSLRLHGGPGCRPPISRMGNKAGYAATILWTLGLTAGKSAGAYVWAEADDDVRALLRCYPDAAMLRAVADIIRGWKDEEPRALWERLRAERKARRPRVECGVPPGEVAAHVFVAGRSIMGDGGFVETEDTGGKARGLRPENFSDRCDSLAEHADVARWTFIQGHESPNGRLAAQYRNPEGTADGSWAAPPREWLTDRVTRLAEYAQIVSANRLINVAGPDLRNTGKGGTTFGGAEFATPAGEVAGAFELAVTGILSQWAFRRGEPESGFNAGLLQDREPTPTGGNGCKARTVEQEAGLWTPAALASSWPPVAVLPRIPSAADLALWLRTPGDLDGVVVYMDPPYQDTTGYLHDLGRADVVRHALDFAGMGAHVAISEAVALPELMALGWYASEITGGRKGQKRTFSKQQGEYLTMNREPAYVVPTQAGLFACAS